MFVVKLLFDDNYMLGYLGAIEALPFLIFGPLAGMVADKMDRKALMMWSDLLGTAILVATLMYVFATPSPPKWLFYVVGFSLSSTRVLFNPAKNASIPKLVPAEQLLGANSISTATDQFAWFLGVGVLGAVGLIAQGDAKELTLGVVRNIYLSVLSVNALSFVASALYIKLLPKIVAEAEQKESSATFLQQILQGINYCKTDKVIGLTLLAQIGISLCISPFFAVYLATNKKRFNNTLWGLTVIEVAFVLGLFCMSLWVGKKRLSRPGLAYGFGIAATGLTVALMGPDMGFGLYVFWNLMAGIAIGIVDPPMMTYQQLRIPDKVSGRVFALKFLIMMGVQPIGMAFAGKLIDRFGLTWMHVMMGIGFGLSGIAPLLNREFRESRISEAEMERVNR
jgi:MFS family permease